MLRVAEIQKCRSLMTYGHKHWRVVVSVKCQIFRQERMYPIIKAGRSFSHHIEEARANFKIRNRLGAPKCTATRPGRLLSLVKEELMASIDKIECLL